MSAKGSFRSKMRKQELERQKEKAMNRPNISVPQNVSFGKSVSRGDIFYIHETPVIGSEQRAGRPGIIVSNDICNETSPFVCIVFLTKQEKAIMPTHVIVESTGQTSTALCEQVHTVAKERLGSYSGVVTEEELECINNAVVVALGLDLCTISTDAYNLLVKELAEANNTIIELREKIKDLENQVEDFDNLINGPSTFCLEQEAPAMLTAMPIDSFSSSEVVKLTTERDTYKNLYENLLEKFLMKV